MKKLLKWEKDHEGWYSNTVYHWRYNIYASKGNNLFDAIASGPYVAHLTLARQLEEAKQFCEDHLLSSLSAGEIIALEERDAKKNPKKLLTWIDNRRGDSELSWVASCLAHRYALRESQLHTKYTPMYAERGYWVPIDDATSYEEAKQICENDLLNFRLTAGELIALDEMEAKKNPKKKELFMWIPTSGGASAAGHGPFDYGAIIVNPRLGSEEYIVAIGRYGHIDSYLPGTRSMKKAKKLCEDALRARLTVGELLVLEES